MTFNGLAKGLSPGGPKQETAELSIKGHGDDDDGPSHLAGILLMHRDGSHHQLRDIPGRDLLGALDAIGANDAGAFAIGEELVHQAADGVTLGSTASGDDVGEV